MLISFIVPVYNIEEYIRPCLDSIICQIGNDCEVIVVDDGSTDNSSSICEEYRNICNVKIIHQINRGLGGARNTGIRNAGGEYVAFVDGDDYIDSNAVEAIRRSLVFQHYPQVVFLKAYKMFEDGSKQLLDGEYDQQKIFGQNADEVLSYVSNRDKYPGSACTKLISRDLITSNDLYFEEGVKSEDLDWTKKLLFSADTFGYCDADYYYYRQNRKGSITNRVSADGYNDRMDIVDRWIRESESINNANRKNVLLSFAAYEYKILLGDLFLIDTDDNSFAEAWLKNRQFLLDYKSDKQIELIKKSVKTVGLKNTGKLLRVYKKITG